MRAPARRPGRWTRCLRRHPGRRFAAGPADTARRRSLAPVQSGPGRARDARLAEAATRSGGRCRDSHASQSAGDAQREVAAAPSSVPLRRLRRRASVAHGRLVRTGGNANVGPSAKTPDPFTVGPRGRAPVRPPAGPAGRPAGGRPGHDPGQRRPRARRRRDRSPVARTRLESRPGRRRSAPPPRPRRAAHVGRPRRVVAEHSGRPTRGAAGPAGGGGCRRAPAPGSERYAAASAGAGAAAASGSDATRLPAAAGGRATRSSGQDRPWRTIIRTTRLARPHDAKLGTITGRSGRRAGVVRRPRRPGRGSSPVASADPRAERRGEAVAAAVTPTSRMPWPACRGVHTPDRPARRAGPHHGRAPIDTGSAWALSGGRVVALSVAPGRALRADTGEPAVAYRPWRRPSAAIGRQRAVGRPRRPIAAHRSAKVATPGRRLGGGGRAGQPTGGRSSSGCGQGVVTPTGGTTVSWGTAGREKHPAPAADGAADRAAGGLVADGNRDASAGGGRGPLAQPRRAG